MAEDETHTCRSCYSRVPIDPATAEEHHGLTYYRCPACYGLFALERSAPAVG